MTQPSTDVPVTPAVSAPAPILPIAVIGEMNCSGRAVLKALGARGWKLRALCSTPIEAQAARKAVPDEAQLEIIEGRPDQNHFQMILQGAGAAVLLSPLSPMGWTWPAGQPQSKLVQLFRTAAELHNVRRVVNLSSLAVDSKGLSECAREAAAAEKELQGFNGTAYMLRVGPLMGPGAAWFEAALRRGRESSLFMSIWGYGADSKLQPLHVDDLARCVVRLIEPFQPSPSVKAAQPGIYCLSGKDCISWLELLDLVLAQKQRFKLKVHTPLFVLKLMAALNSGQSTPEQPSFSEQVALLTTPFADDKNDLPGLLGGNQVKTVEVSLAEAV